eukprot:11481325-Karenia_brevis.AAC.1
MTILGKAFLGNYLMKHTKKDISMPDGHVRNGAQHHDLDFMIELVALRSGAKSSTRGGHFASGIAWPLAA